MDAAAETTFSTPLLISLIVASLIYGTVCGTLVFHRRGKFPMDGREISFVISLVFVATIHGVIQLTSLIYEAAVPCWVETLFTFFSLVLAHLINVRLFRLWFKANLSRDLRQYHLLRSKLKPHVTSRKSHHEENESKESESPKAPLHEHAEISTISTTNSVDDRAEHKNTNDHTARSFKFIRWSKFGEAAFLWRILLGVFLLDAAATYVFGFVLDECASFSSGPAFYYLLFVFGTSICVLVTLAWKVRHISDGFFIQTEMKHWGVSAVLWAPLFGIVGFVGTSPMYLMTSWALLIHYLFIIVIFPLSKSYGSDFHPNNPLQWIKCAASACICRMASNDNMTTPSQREEFAPLMEVLTDEKCMDIREQFERHVVSEFAFENLAFFDYAVEFFEQSDTLSDDQQALRAVEIFFEFIAVGSTQQVNISARARETISRRIKASFVNYEDFKPSRSSARVRRDSAVFTAFNGAAPRDQIPTEPARSVQEMAHVTTGSSQSSHISRTRKRAPSIELNDRLPKDVFEGARRLVFTMLERDCYSRFKKSQRSYATAASTALSIELDA